MRIEPEHPIYRTLLERFQRDNGVVTLNGKFYMAVQDNDMLVFVETHPQGNFDTGYERSSFKN